MQSESSEPLGTRWRFTALLLGVGVVLEWVVPGVAPRWVDAYVANAGRLAELLGLVLGVERAVIDAWGFWTHGRAVRRERRLYRDALRARAVPPTRAGSSVGPSRSSGAD